jgi:Aspartate-ammonia ligase
VGTGVNDELDGSASKSAVRFTVPNVDVPRGIAQEAAGEQQQATSSSSSSPPPYQMECEVVQSLAKWKRIMLGRLDCPVGTGIYCDSTSIRKGYKGDVTHSVIADQWGTCVLSRWTTQRYSVVGSKLLVHSNVLFSFPAQSFGHTYKNLKTSKFI